MKTVSSTQTALWSALLPRPRMTSRAGRAGEEISCVCRVWTLGFRAVPRLARKRWTARIRVLRGEPTLGWPKWAVAKRPTKLSMQKQLMALYQRLRQVKTSHPMTMRQRRTIAPLSLMAKTQDQYAGPVRLPGAAAEDAEVIGVLEVLSEHDVAVVKERLWSILLC
jgi:hypothetical protein